MSEPIKAQCCDMGKQWIRWDTGTPAWPVDGRWIRRFTSRLEGCLVINFCPDCGTKLEPPKPKITGLTKEEYDGLGHLLAALDRGWFYGEKEVNYKSALRSILSRVEEPTQ